MPSTTYIACTNTVRVTYPVREAEQSITLAEANLIRSIPTIHAVKFIRDQYSLGLYEANQLVKTVVAHPDF